MNRSTTTKGNAFYVPDAVAYFDKALDMVWHKATTLLADLKLFNGLGRKLNSVRFYESEIMARPFLSTIIDYMKCVVKIDADNPRLTGVEAMKIMNFMIVRGFTLIPWNESKMGGNAPKLYFMKLDMWRKFLDTWGIAEAYDRLVKEKPAAVPARLKKLFGYISKLNGITVVFGPVPYKGIGLMHPDTIVELGMHNFDKMGGMVKVSVAPSTLVGRGILMIDPSEDKWKLGAEKLADYLYKDNQNTVVIKSSILNDALAKFSRDVQLILGIDPKVVIASEDLQFNKTKVYPNSSWLYTNFGYYDKARECYSLGDLGKAIMRGQFRMADALGQLFSRMLDRSRNSTPGAFGVAAPRQFAPKHLKLQHVWLLRYPNRVMVDTYCYIDEFGVIYVDPELWETMGGDYDGDLAFIFPHTLVSDSALPVWPRDKELLKSLMPVAEKSQASNLTLEESFCNQLDSATLIGMTHNTLSFALESMLADGASRDVVIKAAMKLSNKFVQPFIDKLKYHIGDMRAPSVIDMLKVVRYFIKYANICRTSRERMMFNSVHGWINVMKILEAANIADPKSRLASERLVAQFKPFLG